MEGAQRGRGALHPAGQGAGPGDLEGQLEPWPRPAALQVASQSQPCRPSPARFLSPSQELRRPLAVPGLSPLGLQLAQEGLLLLRPALQEPLRGPQLLLALGQLLPEAGRGLPGRL